MYIIYCDDLLQVNVGCGAERRGKKYFEAFSFVMMNVFMYI